MSDESSPVKEALEQRREELAVQYRARSLAESVTKAEMAEARRQWDNLKVVCEDEGIELPDIEAPAAGVEHQEAR